MDKTYESIPGIFPALWCCQNCGGAVWDKELHNEVECG